MTAGRRDRERKVAIGLIVLAGFMHVVAFVTLGGSGNVGLNPDVPTLIIVTTGAVLSGSAMLSQAMEGVTRVFYTRSDLELILTSPVPSHRLFAVRIAAIALSVSLMSMLLIGPFIDILAWQGGLRWLGGYGLIIAISLIVTALAVILTVILFHTMGPKYTRLVAQIAAAVIGGMFVIGLQMAAIFSTGTTSRLAFLKSEFVVAHAPDIGSVLWWPARAGLGDWLCTAIVVTASLALFVVITLRYAPRFAACAIAASGVSRGAPHHRGSARAFRVEPAPSALRRKEMLLLIRDPWLISQSLMQVLYLLPPALLLWLNFTTEGGASIILVPTLVMAAGQLAGGLAWLTISGEDAPDLVATSPIPETRLLRAKIEAVLECIGVLFFPFVMGLGLVSPMRGLLAAFGIAAASASAATIQLWFRSQAKRSQFRRRHTSSRIATFSEAFSSVAWAATGAVAAAGSWTAGVVAVFPIGVLACARLLSPASTPRHVAPKS
jgi:ABC-2 type transport system permease protein